MNKLYILGRNISSLEGNLLHPTSYLKYIYLVKSTNNSPNNTTSSSSDSSGTSSDSDAETDRSKIPSKSKNESALNKLNMLLKQIVDEEVVRTESKLNFARPTNKRLNKLEPESHKTETVEKQMVNAVKDVAQELGGNIKQTESELLLKLLTPNETSTGASTMNLSEIVKGMKIDRESKPSENSRSEQIQRLLQQVKTRSTPRESTESVKRPRRPLPQKRIPDSVMEKIDLFGSEPLHIFTNKDLKESRENTTWQSLYERDMKLAVTHPPANYFQQMILWTEQGKVWKFPIDNEQGLEEEKQVYFAKHIFLEDHLEPWCPPKGPIRHFMELVCVGLSKNPYLTVEAKKEHIEWYKNYFEDKKKLLQEVGALPNPNETQKRLE